MDQDIDNPTSWGWIVFMLLWKSHTWFPTPNQGPFVDKLRQWKCLNFLCVARASCKWWERATWIPRDAEVDNLLQGDFSRFLDSQALSNRDGHLCWQIKE